MRKFRLLPLVIVVLLFVAAPVMAAGYYATFVVTESNGNDYTMLAVQESNDNQWLADNGFMEADALDTRIETLGGSVKPHLVVDDRMLTAIPVPADSQTNLYFTTGNSDLASMDIIPGYDGYVTVSDSADLELANDFTVELDGYLDTDIPDIYVTGSDDTGLNHTVDLPLYIDPDCLLVVFFACDDDTENITFPAGWTQLYNDDDGADISFACFYREADGTEGDSITVTTASNESSAHTVYRIDGYSGTPEAGVSATGNSVNPDPSNLAPSWGAGTNTLWFAACGYDGNPTTSAIPANYSDERNDVEGLAGGAGVGTALRLLDAASENPGTFTITAGEQWVANTVAVQYTGDLEVTDDLPDIVSKDDSFQLTIAYDDTVYARIVGGGNAEVAATATTGEHKVEAWADGANLYISVDDAVAGDGYDSVALGGASAADNGNNWILFDENSSIYLEYYKHTTAASGVSEGLELWYQPDTMIIGTDLPDRAIGYTPTSAAGAGWANPNNTWDDNTATFAGVAPGAGNWSNDLTISHAAVTISAVRVYTPVIAGVDLVDIDVNLDGAWEDLYDGAPSTDWLTLTFDEGSVTDVRFKGHQTGAGQVLCGEVDFGYADSTQDGTFTWGSNPAGVSVELGSMVSDDQPSVGTIEDDPTDDVLPANESSDWFVEPDVAGTLLTNPMRPFVTIMSDTTTLTELQAWRLLGLAIVLMVTASAIYFVHEHLIVAGIACGAAIGGMVALTIFPLWALVFVVGAIAGGAVAERSPVL